MERVAHEVDSEDDSDDDKDDGGYFSANEDMSENEDEEYSSDAEDDGMELNSSIYVIIARKIQHQIQNHTKHSHSGVTNEKVPKVSSTAA